MIQEKNRILLIGISSSYLDSVTLFLNPLTFSLLNPATHVDVESVPTESEDDSADAAVIHGVAAEAERREVGESGDVSEDSRAEKEVPEATIQASKRRKAIVIENSDSDPASPPKTKR
ncbi:hypothetical protein ACFX19_033799 [Malus domestica]